MERGKTLPNECHGYETKPSDTEVPVMLKRWGMWRNLSLPSLPVLFQAIKFSQTVLIQTIPHNIHIEFV